MEPGEKLYLVFDANRFPESLKFTGVSATINYFLRQLQPTNQQVNNYLNSKWVQLFSKDEPGFYAIIDSLKSLYTKPLDSLLQINKKINPSFAFTTRNATNFTFDRFLLLYSQNHTRFTGKAVPTGGMIEKYLAKVNLDNAGLLEVEDYEKFGRAWLYAKIEKEFKNNQELHKQDNRWLNAAFLVIQREFKNQEAQGFWLYHYLYDHLDNHGIKNIEQNINLFNKLCRNQALKDKIAVFYRKEKANRSVPLVRTYKKINDLDLEAFIFLPKYLKEGEKRPAMVYFHGGSWSEGKPDWHFGYSKNGLVNVCVDYRTNLRHGVLPFEEVADAKSLFRWLRQHAAELYIDPSKIIAQGNSAGGHLILCAAMVDTLDEPHEDTAISSKPNALILNAAVYDLSGWNPFDPQGNNKQKFMAISPTHHIKANLPPMLVFHGTADNNVPFETAKAFTEKMKQAVNQIDFYPIEDSSHLLWFNPEYQKVSENIKLDFLKKNGFL